MLKIVPAALLCCAAVTATAHEETRQPDAPQLASVDALVRGGETCAVGKRQERKMLAHIEASGFERFTGAELETREGRHGRRDPAGINLYHREGVQLTYFHSRIMRSCTAEGVVDEAFRTEDLLQRLAETLAKEPRVDTPGEKYLFNVSDAILTVQIKQADGETTVSLGTVRT